MEVCDVAHDCRIKPIELLLCNAVQRLDTELESATRERAKEEHDRIHKEYQSPEHHKACAIAQGLLSGHCLLLALDDIAQICMKASFGQVSSEAADRTGCSRFENAMRSAPDEGMAIGPRLPISGLRTNTSFDDRDSRL